MYKPIIDSKIERYKREYYFDLVYVNNPDNVQHIFRGKDLQFQGILKKRKKPDTPLGKPMFEMTLTLSSYLIQIKELTACNLAGINEARKELFFNLFIYSLKEYIAKDYEKAGIIVSSQDPFIQDALVDNGFKIKTFYINGIHTYSGMWRKLDEANNTVENK